MVYSEPELIIPALKIFKEYERGVSTSRLIRILTERLRPTGRDAQILSNRRDTHFSQKVRNLKSHNTLTGKGVATYENGIWRITGEGERYLEENEPLFISMREQGFSRREVEREIDRDYSGVIIEEGFLQIISTTQRERSRRLKRIAIDKFKREHDGRVFCSVCSFDFSEVYREHGRDFIEMHHTTPIHEMEIEGSGIQLADALRKVVLLCSNCHRIVHRRRGEMLSIEQLRGIIQSPSLS